MRRCIRLKTSILKYGNLRRQRRTTADQRGGGSAAEYFSKFLLEEDDFPLLQQLNVVLKDVRMLMKDFEGDDATVSTVLPAIVGWTCPKTEWFDKMDGV